MTGSDDRYTVISADTHAGGSHAQYREFLEEKYLEQFDAWREKYRNPFSDLGDDRRLRNWDDEMRNRQQDEDGVSGEVIFPNTVPPFFPSFVLFAPPAKPDDYELRLAGVRAHNRWMVDFQNRFPERRAGIGQIFINDIDDAIEDVKWIAEHGLRGGILLPNVPPDVTWIKPIYHPDYDRLWEVCEDLGVPVNIHGGTGTPNYGRTPAALLMLLAEAGHFSRRPLLFLLLGGVLERFPKLNVVLTEQGAAFLPGLLDQLDGVIKSVRDNGAIGELRFAEDAVLPRSATEYVAQSVWFGASFPTRKDVAAVCDTIGLDHLMWGSDYPHDEGTFPHTLPALRQVFHDWDPADVRQVLTDNPARLYGFDPSALAAHAAQFGPKVSEVAEPLTELPDKPNEAILRNARELRHAS
ncbi:MAG TPA: amidohydrolase family protein [Acidimicrobiales bacterium]|jgi:predicted TIM-barrel fold metal-dependent hydrolase|nr:amidohydrolase family protein [Acidimicrobiales bacterium]